MWNAGLDEAQAGIKIARRNINNLKYADDTTLMAENKEELKSLLLKMKDESEKAGLIVNIQKANKTMVSSSITSWQIDGKRMETVTDFIFLVSKITEDGDCSHEIKRCMPLGRNAMTNLDTILKSRDITLLTKVHLVKAMVLPLGMYGCKSWTIKKLEVWRTDAFELLEKTLESPLDCKKIKPVDFLREINTEYSLEGLMLKVHYFDHLIYGADSLENTLMLGKTKTRRRRKWQRMR